VRCALLALNALTLGGTSLPKTLAMHEVRANTCYLAKPLLSRYLTGGTRCGRGRERGHLLQGAIGPVLAVAEGTAVADLESVKQAVFMLGSLSEVSSRHAPKSSGVPLNLRPCPPCSSSPVIKCSLKLSAWSRVHLLVRTKLGG
jgi:hypothetical protein